MLGALHQNIEMQGHYRLAFGGNHCTIDGKEGKFMVYGEKVKNNTHLVKVGQIENGVLFKNKKLFWVDISEVNFINAKGEFYKANLGKCKLCGCLNGYKNEIANLKAEIAKLKA